MSLTPKQQDRLAELRSEQVAFPPSFEAEGGAIRVLLVVSFECIGGEIPRAIEVELVQVEKDGSNRIVEVGVLRLDRRSQRGAW